MNEERKDLANTCKGGCGRKTKYTFCGSEECREDYYEASKAEIKDLAYFQQQVAEQNGYIDWSDAIKDENCEIIIYWCNQAAELYAEHRFEEGKQAGRKESVKQIRRRIEELLTIKDNFSKNESVYQIITSSVSELEKVLSILNGLKSVEEE